MVCLHLQVLRVVTIPYADVLTTLGFTLKDDRSETCQEVYKESIWEGLRLESALLFLISETLSTRFFLPKNAISIAVLREM
jgi:hypothetical protein